MADREHDQLKNRVTTEASWTWRRNYTVSIKSYMQVRNTNREIRKNNFISM